MQFDNPEFVKLYTTFFNEHDRSLEVSMFYLQGFWNPTTHDAFVQREPGAAKIMEGRTQEEALYRFRVSAIASGVIAMLLSERNRQGNTGGSRV